MTTSRETHDTTGRCGFVPPYVLERLGATDALAVDAAFRAARERASTVRSTALEPGERDAPAWTVHTARNREVLPGDPVRTPGTPESGDPAVDEAAAGITATLEMFAQGLGRSSYDDAGAPVSLTVHYGRDYDNAFWDGTQLVFGDGDGEVFERFTRPVDVLAHEFAHAVTEHTAGLVYRGQSGALNESVSDVFAICLKQRVLGQDAASGSWLIGEDLFAPSVQARGLRDMAAPGTAYDDPRLGRDPQPDHMDRYVDTTDDNGGRAPQLRHPQPRLPPRRGGDRRHEPRGCRPGLVRRAHLGPGVPARRLRGVRGRHRGRGGRARGRRARGVAAGRRRAGPLVGRPARRCPGPRRAGRAGAAQRRLRGAHHRGRGGPHRRRPPGRRRRRPRRSGRPRRGGAAQADARHVRLPLRHRGLDGRGRRAAAVRPGRARAARARGVRRDR